MIKKLQVAVILAQKNTDLNLKQKKREALIENGRQQKKPKIQFFFYNGDKYEWRIKIKNQIKNQKQKIQKNKK